MRAKMISINFNDYRLVYYRKSDGRKFYVRRVTSSDYRIIDSETNLKSEISYYYLRKDYELDRNNFLKMKEVTQVRVC
jgi:hypothetical protein